MGAYSAMPILVVEDNRTMRRIIRTLLKQIGFGNVDDSSDGSSALIRMTEKKYELIISDWNMDPLSGYELLRHVRADPRFARVRFILTTAESKPEQVLAAKKAGASSYIIKPFTADVLKEKIDAAFLL
jgi:two-component system, chemotaxis family, chemotaxis protein CheY